MLCGLKKKRHQSKMSIANFGQTLWLVIISILLVFFDAKDVLSTMNSVIQPCKTESYITIDSLYDFCGLPGICGEELACEGQTALIQGYIDYGNVFDKTAYPMLPYQKFLLTNAEHSRTLEIWVASEGSEAVFKKIAENKVSKPDGPIYVTGILAGFDMPIMGTCHRGLKLNLTGAMSISYDGDGLLPKKQ
jgi:hypothetical protein